jgi:hypothetical protein
MQAEQNKKTQSQIQYSIERENIRSDLNEVFNKYYNKLFSSKADFQKRKTNLQIKHSNYIADVEEEYAKELELETSRSIPEADVQKKEAQIRATNGEFDYADQLFRESNDFRERVIKERQDVVHSKYRTLFSQVNVKQEADMEYLKQKEQQAYTQILLEYESELTRLRKQLQICSIKYSVERNIEEDEKLFKHLELKSFETAEKPPKSPKSPRTPKINKL